MAYFKLENQVLSAIAYCVIPYSKCMKGTSESMRDRKKNKVGERERERK